MTAQELIAHGLAKPGAYLDTPFGPEPVCVRVERAIFAEVYPGRDWVTLRCEPSDGLMWRGRYPDAVRRGYHCPPVQQPYHNTVLLDGSVPDDELLQMLDGSYQRALRSLTKSARLRVEADAGKDE